MNRTGRDNTVSHALHREYQVAVSIVVIVFVCFLGLSEIISRMYANSTEHLRNLNQMESSFIEMNNTVNMAYNFLRSEGISEYEVIEKRLLNEVTNLRQDNQHAYSREIEDLLNTLETFTSESDELMDMISAYIARDPERNITEQQLTERYQNLQIVYGYTVLRFQDSYSAQLTSYSQAQARLNWARTVITAVMGCILIIMILWYIRFTRRMTSSITEAVDTLQDGVTSIETDLDSFQPITVNSYDELNHLADAYNRMHTMILLQMHKIQENAGIKERLVQAENQNLRMYAEMQRNHLDFLQSRINPHFLFNALNMISSMAHIEGAEKSAELMETTAQFLRYNLDNISKTMTLRDELRNLRDYIEIQKCRYDDRYQFEYDVDPACYAQEMPCMVLQPLVENAIQHGVGMKMNGGVIRISTLRQQDRVLLAVYDNGVGMTKEQIDSVKRDVANAQSSNTHIGLRNIYRRLDLFYHGDVALDIRQENPGVTISLSLPLTVQTEGTTQTSRTGGSEQ